MNSDTCRRSQSDAKNDDIEEHEVIRQNRQSRGYASSIKVESKECDDKKEEKQELRHSFHQSRKERCQAPDEEPMQPEELLPIDIYLSLIHI